MEQESVLREVTFELMFDSGEIGLYGITGLVDLTMDGSLQGEAYEAALKFSRDFWPEEHETRHDWEILPSYLDDNGDIIDLDTFFFSELDVA